MLLKGRAFALHVFVQQLHNSDACDLELRHRPLRWRVSEGTALTP